MPYRKRTTKKRYGKRKFYRRKRRYVRKAKRGASAYSGYMLGRSQKATLLYHHAGAIKPATDSTACYLFRANSTYDPDFTGVGHQPRGFDQFMTMFDHCTVIGSKITIKLHNGDAVGPGVVATLSLRDDSVCPDPTTQLETPGVQKAILGVQGSGRDTGTLIQTFSAKKFFRRKPLSDPNLACSAIANPSEQAFYVLQLFYDATLGIITKETELNFFIEYTCVFTEPKMPNAS